MNSLPSRLPEIEIPLNEPFKNDKLGYSKYAETLKTLVDLYSESGCVLAINGRWGSGKTTFMKMWNTYLISQSYNTVYFNAWETDYFSDPLTAILGELKDIGGNDDTINKVLASAGKLALGLTRNVISNVAKNILGIDSPIVNGVIDEGHEQMKNSLDEYKKHKISLAEFRDRLSHYVADHGNHPVVFIVDELDRCNPHYAVKTLETIKHLFVVPNIIFVLAIDKIQLEYSIQGFYGSSGIDADNYLRRFIDIQFDIPSPKRDQFIELLYDHYHYSEYFESGRKTYNGITKENDFKEMATLMFNMTEIDLRTCDKIFAHARLAANQLGGNDQVVLPIAFLLCFLRIAHYELYCKIKSKAMSVQELITSMETIFPRDILINNEDNYRTKSRFFLWTFGEMLYFYDYSLNGDHGPIRSHKEKELLDLQCKVMDKNVITEAVEWCNRGHNFNSSLGIEFFTTKIELLSNFK